LRGKCNEKKKRVLDIAITLGGGLPLVKKSLLFSGKGGGGEKASEERGKDLYNIGGGKKKKTVL